MKRYIVTEGQSLMDVSMLVYGDISGMLTLIKDNDGISSLTEALIPGQIIVYNESIDLTEDNYTPLKAAQSSTRGKYIVSYGQTLMDVAIELYGDITGMLRLIEDNSSLRDINSDLQAGQVLKYDTSFAINEAVKTYFKARSVNTGEINSIVGLISFDDVLLISFDNILLEAKA
jgi:hypothetical protein